MRGISLGLCALLLVGCGGDDTPKSTCTDFLDHFYGVGCVLVDISYNPPVELAYSEALYACRQIGSEAQNYCPNCKSKYRAWLNCRTDVTCTDCMHELDEFVYCCY